MQPSLVSVLKWHKVPKEEKPFKKEGGPEQRQETHHSPGRTPSAMFSVDCPAVKEKQRGEVSDSQSSAGSGFIYTARLNRRWFGVT